MISNPPSNSPGDEEDVRNRVDGVSFSAGPSGGAQSTNTQRNDGDNAFQQKEVATGSGRQYDNGVEYDDGDDEEEDDNLQREINMALLQE